jgi:hypothetical protein
VLFFIPPLPHLDASTSRSGNDMTLREIWRSLVLYALFFALLIIGRRELPAGDSILLWYVIIASAAVPALIAKFWR